VNEKTLRADAVLHLPFDGVDVYICNLHTWQAQGSAHLSAAEQARAGKFVFARHRYAFERAHHFLRETLGRVLGADPATLVFTTSAHGKPALANPHLLQFNLSHSEHHAAVAISRAFEVGVDIEDPHPVDDALALARRHFTLAEQSELLAAPEGSARERMFLQGWTRKEACLKAIGSGFSLPAQAVDVGLALAPRQLIVQWETRDYPLALTSFSTAQGVIGAVAGVLK
jgi:4'-phosphopantetheinyl transferase